MIGRELCELAFASTSQDNSDFAIATKVDLSKSSISGFSTLPE